MNEPAPAAEPCWRNEAGIPWIDLFVTPNIAGEGVLEVSCRLLTELGAAAVNQFTRQVREGLAMDGIRGVDFVVSPSPFLSEIVDSVVSFLRQYTFPDGALIYCEIRSEDDGTEMLMPRGELLSIIDRVLGAVLEKDHKRAPLAFVSPTTPSEAVVHRMIDLSASKMVGLSVGVPIDSDQTAPLEQRAYCTKQRDNSGSRSFFFLKSSDAECEVGLPSVFRCRNIVELHAIATAATLPHLIAACQSFDLSAVGHVIMGRVLEISDDVEAFRLDGSTLYESLIAGSPSLEHVSLLGFTFGDTNREKDAHSSTLNDHPTVEHLELIDCALGRESTHCFSKGSVQSLRLSGCRSSSRTPSSIDLVHDFVRLASHHLGVEKLDLFRTSLELHEVTSLCHWLTDDDCKVNCLFLGGYDKDGTPVLDSDSVITFFGHFPNMQSLEVLALKHSVTTLPLSQTVINGVRANLSIRYFSDLSFDLDDTVQNQRLLREVVFWVNSNNLGRHLVEAHLANPDRVPRVLLARHFHLINTMATSDDESDLVEYCSVMFHFVRRLLPCWLDRLTTIKKRPRS